MRTSMCVVSSQIYIAGKVAGRVAQIEAMRSRHRRAPPEMKGGGAALDLPDDHIRALSSVHVLGRAWVELALLLRCDMPGPKPTPSATHDTEIERESTSRTYA